jgi:hypothetical protein
MSAETGKGTDYFVAVDLHGWQPQVFINSPLQRGVADAHESKPF